MSFSSYDSLFRQFSVGASGSKYAADESGLDGGQVQAAGRGSG